MHLHVKFANILEISVLRKKKQDCVLWKNRIKTFASCHFFI